MITLFCVLTHVIFHLFRIDRERQHTTTHLIHKEEHVVQHIRSTTHVSKYIDLLEENITQFSVYCFSVEFRLSSELVIWKYMCFLINRPEKKIKRSNFLRWAKHRNFSYWYKFRHLLPNFKTLFIIFKKKKKDWDYILFVSSHKKWREKIVCNKICYPVSIVNNQFWINAFLNVGTLNNKISTLIKHL